MLFKKTLKIQDIIHRPILRIFSPLIISEEHLCFEVTGFIKFENYKVQQGVYEVQQNNVF